MQLFPSVLWSEPERDPFSNFGNEMGRMLSHMSLSEMALTACHNSAGMRIVLWNIGSRSSSLPLHLQTLVLVLAPPKSKKSHRKLPVDIWEGDGKPP